MAIDRLIVAASEDECGLEVDEDIGAEEGLSLNFETDGELVGFEDVGAEDGLSDCFEDVGESECFEDVGELVVDTGLLLSFEVLMCSQTKKTSCTYPNERSGRTPYSRESAESRVSPIPGNCPGRTINCVHRIVVQSYFATVFSSTFNTSTSSRVATNARFSLLKATNPNESSRRGTLAPVRKFKIWPPAIANSPIGEIAKRESLRDHSYNKQSLRQSNRRRIESCARL